MRGRYRGFTYVGLLVAVALIGVMLAAASTLWRITAQREKEVELLFVGHEFRNAIAHYYTAGGVRYPHSLEDLLDDERSPVPRHFLRRIYADPMTGNADWQLIRINDGAIIGVASKSQGKPMKRANFELADEALIDKDCYCDWQFIYLPRRLGSTPNSASNPAPNPDPSPVPNPEPTPGLRH